MANAQVQVVASNTVVNVFEVNASATVDSGGGSVSWPGGSISAQSGQTFYMQEGAAIGWVLSGGVLAAPAITIPAPTPAQLQAYASAKAQALLTVINAYTADGATIKADAQASTIADLNSRASLVAPTATDNWVANDNSVTAVTGAQFAALAPLVAAYRASVYGSALAAVLGEIASGEITTYAGVDAYAWPA